MRHRIFLFGEGFGDMICLLPTVRKTAEQMNKRLDAWTRRPEVFGNHPMLNPERICCLPTVDQVLEAATSFLRDRP
ncbi:MAG: hypothetical protein QF721_03210 [Verrucomicrobiota bacterium]|jgi:hypothetical protein|nr:hypothetical protein [Verrucomicrobiota bacterium]MDP7048437.1 hypothetical protein [Verrucomicrobiota bacterium]